MQRVSLLLVTGLLSASSAYAADERPEGMTVAIGGGVSIPASPLALNTASVRLHINNQIAIEPVLIFDSTKTTDKTKNTTTTAGQTADIKVEALGRLRLAKKGRADLQLLAGLAIDSDSTATPEDTKNNLVLNTTNFGVVWGLGTEYWLHEHWSISGDAVNDLFELTSSKTTDQAAKSTTAESTTAFGVGWDPGIRFQVHLYF